MSAEIAADATQTLAKFASALRYEDIPSRVREHCKDLLLDALACAVAGRLGEETGQVTALASSLAQSHEATVIGGEPLSLAGATLLNGYLITAVTMCDVHRETMTHVTPEVVPPSLAIAERDQLSGRALLLPPGSRSQRASVSAATIRCFAPAAGMAPASLGRSAQPPQSDRCCRSMPTRWRAPLGSPAAKPPALSPPGARRR